MKFSTAEFYSDLAAEEYSKIEAEYAASHRGKPDGIVFRSFCERGMRCEEVRILTADAAQRFGKPRGTYLTLYSGVLSELDRTQLKSRVFLLAKLIRRIAKKAAPQAERILVCGLGNRQMTADAIGPMVSDRLGATLHLAKTPQQLGANALLCAFSPGVVGQTGIETAALCKGAVRAAEPELVIVIDALAAREKERFSNRSAVRQRACTRRRCRQSPLLRQCGKHRRARDVDRGTDGDQCGGAFIRYTAKHRLFSRRTACGKPRKAGAGNCAKPSAVCHAR